jgi:hypothetical protein
MARSAPGGLSQHPTKGFRLKIGKRPDGKPRLFWLGHDRPTANAFAHILRHRFMAMKRAGRDIWLDDDVQDCREFVATYREAMEAMRMRLAKDQSELDMRKTLLEAVWGNRANEVSKTPAKKSSAETTGNLHAAIDAYVEGLKQGAISSSHKERTVQLLGDLKRLRSDVTLASIDRVWLQELTDYLRSRPKSRKNGRPLAPRAG